MYLHRVVTHTQICTWTPNNIIIILSQLVMVAPGTRVTYCSLALCIVYWLLVLVTADPLAVVVLALCPSLTDKNN